MNVISTGHGVAEASKAEKIAQTMFNDGENIVTLETLCYKSIAKSIHLFFPFITTENRTNVHDLSQSFQEISTSTTDLKSSTSISEPLVTDETLDCNPIDDDSLMLCSHLLEENCTHNPKCCVRSIEKNSIFCSSDIIFPVNIANRILKHVNKEGRMNDAVALFFSNQKFFPFNQLYLRNCEKLSSSAIINLLQKCNLKEIDVKDINSPKPGGNQSGLKQRCALKDIIHHLTPWSKENLESLNISGLKVKKNNKTSSIYLNVSSQLNESFQSCIYNLMFLGISI